MTRNRFSIRVCLLAGLLTLATAGSAAAGPILFADVFTTSEVFFKSTGGACVGTNGATDTISGQANGGCDSLAFSLLLPDYNPAIDTLYSALVSFAFHDDGRDGKETLNIQLDTVSRNATVRSTGSNNSPSLFLFWNPLEQLAVDGRLDLVLTRRRVTSGSMELGSPRPAGDRTRRRRRRRFPNRVHSFCSALVSLVL